MLASTQGFLWSTEKLIPKIFENPSWIHVHEKLRDSQETKKLFTAHAIIGSTHENVGKYSRFSSIFKKTFIKNFWKSIVNMLAGKILSDAYELTLHTKTYLFVDPLHTTFTSFLSRQWKTHKQVTGIKFILCNLMLFLLLNPQLNMENSNATHIFY